MNKKADQSANKKRFQNQKDSEPELKGSEDMAAITPDSLRGRTLMALLSNDKFLKLKLLRDIADSTFSLSCHPLAIHAYELLIKIDSDQDLDLYDNLSFSYAQVEDYENAIETLERYCKLNPSDTFGLFKLASVCRSAKQYDEAIKYYKQVLGTEGDTSMVHRDLGEAYLELGDIESALKEYEMLKVRFRDTPEVEELSKLIKDKRDGLSTLLNKFSGWSS